jgi:hypothetical protein
VKKGGNDIVRKIRARVPERMGDAIKQALMTDARYIEARCEGSTSTRWNAGDRRCVTLAVRME